MEKRKQKEEEEEEENRARWIDWPMLSSSSFKTDRHEMGRAHEFTPTRPRASSHQPLIRLHHFLFQAHQRQPLSAGRGKLIISSARMSLGASESER